MADLGALSVGGAAAIIAVWGVITQRVIARRRATLDFLSKAEADHDLIEARHKFIELARAPGGLAAWADEDKEKTVEVQSIRIVLNEFELVAIGIQHGIIDFALYSKWHKSGVIRYWKHAHPFVVSLRNRTQNNVLFYEFEEMVRWLEGKRLPSRSRLWGQFF